MSEEQEKEVQALEVTMKDFMEDILAIHEYKQEVDNLTSTLMAVITNYEFRDKDKDDPRIKMSLINRAVGSVHQFVAVWYAQAAANYTVVQKRQLGLALEENLKLKRELHHSKETLAECMLGLREVAVLSVHPKDRAKNWNSKKSRENFKHFIKTGETPKKKVARKKGKKK